MSNIQVPVQELEQLKTALIQILSDKKLTLLFLAGVIGFFTLPFCICSFVVAATPNAGFNVVLTALLNVCHTMGSIFVLSNSKTPIAIGFLFGVSVGMIIINLLTAVYWGQLSKCTTFKQNFNQYSCTAPDAYGAVSAFAVLIFLVLLIFTSLIYKWRTNLLDDTTNTNDITNSHGYDSLPNPTGPIGMNSINSIKFPEYLGGSHRYNQPLQQQSADL